MTSASTPAFTPAFAPALAPASEADFRKSNGALLGWAVVLGVSLLSFLVHVHPDEGMVAEHAAQGLLVVGAAVVLAQGGIARLVDEWSGAGDAARRSAAASDALAAASAKTTMRAVC